MPNLYNKKLLIFDYETEGLSELYSRPWQIGFCIYEKNEEIFNYSSYIKWPNLNVSPGAARATHFNPVVVEKEGKDPKEVLGFFWEHLYDDKYTIAGHNILGYDVQINNVARRESGLKPDYSFVRRCLDSNAIARGIKLNMLPKPGDNFVAWQYKMLEVRAKGVKTSITALCKEFNIECDESRLHEAIFDVRMNYKIFQELEKKLRY
jgi:DNA polymerase III epsilon subunit-like protein